MLVHPYRSEPVALAEVVTAFAHIHGQAPTRVGRAPGRVNLLGEHTDHSGGLCLPLALPHSTYAALRPRTDGVVRITSADLDDRWTGTVDDLRDATGWAAYPAGTLWTLAVNRGVDLLISSDVPVGAGLSSSAALTCAVAVAATPDPLTDEVRDTLLTATIRAENEVVGVPTGGLDQAAALFAPDRGALRLDFGSDPPGRDAVPLALADHELLVIDTRVSHALADSRYAERRAQCLAAVALLGVATLSDADPAQVSDLSGTHPVPMARARHVLSENDRVRQAVVALRAGDTAVLGSLLDASHRSLRDDFAVSCAELDAACEVAVAAGALGARMVGGGFGGSALALVPAALVAGVGAAVGQHFAAMGWAAPRFVHAGLGGRRAGPVDI